MIPVTKNSGGLIPKDILFKSTPLFCCDKKIFPIVNTSPIINRISLDVTLLNNIQYSVTSENNYSKVIYCFDCDKQDSKEDDRKFLEKAKKYCKEHEYEFVWFCKDVEDVYLGKQVDRSEKTKEAVRFKKNNLIKKVDSKNLVAQTYKAKTSNIMKVLDRYEELNRNV